MTETVRFGTVSPVDYTLDNMKRYICYCFKYTERDIIKDLIENNGTSSIMAKIADSKKQSKCNCGENHPEHR